MTTATSPGAPIPQAVRLHLRAPEMKSRLSKLQGPKTAAFLRSVAFNYGIISLAIAGCAVSTGSWWLLLAYPIALVVIGARQHALLILMHDATHYLAASKRGLNEWLGELLTAAPMFVSMQNYRVNHLAHHQQLNTDADPDWVRKVHSVDERGYWIFPTNQSAIELFSGLYKRSIGYLVRSLKDNSTADTDTPKRPLADPSNGVQGDSVPGDSVPGDGVPGRSRPDRIRRTRNLLYLVTILILSYAGAWGYFLALWLAPTLLVLPMLMRLRSIAEHFALPHDHPLRESRNIQPGYLERFFLAPHNIGAHLDHHIVASVPVHNLPELHELLMECEEFRRHAHNNDGYLFGRKSLLRDMYHTPSARLSRTHTTSPGLRDAAVA